MFFIEVGKGKSLKGQIAKGTAEIIAKGTEYHF
jgi:hypothetical protein